MVEIAPSPARPSSLSNSSVMLSNRRSLAACARLFCFACLAIAGLSALSTAAAQDARLGTSGLPLPRFVSLKSGEVNLRTGPGKRYPIDWIYRRRGFPVEIIDEFEDWRRVRDHDGTVGWVHRFMLVSRRTVLVTGGTRMLRRRPETEAPGLVHLEAGVIADLKDCDRAWCRIEAQGFDGWLRREAIYGTTADD